MGDENPPGATPRSSALAHLRERVRPILDRYVPILGWLPGYPRDWLRPDLIASVTSWGVMVPVAMAYAELAGVPPEYGLITAFAALGAYAVFGTSRHLKVTTSSTMAVMSASVVVGLAAGDPDRYLALSAALALVVGVILIGAGIVRLGFIADFLAKSVVTGFIFGLAITIIIGQLPKVLGVPSGGDTTLGQLQNLVTELPGTNPWTLAVGAGALALILVLRAISRKIPGPLIALVLGILAVNAFDLTAHDVSVVGDVGTGIPIPGLPRVSLLDLPFLAAGAAGIVFLAVGESLGAGRAFAARHRYEIDPDKELIGLGAANVSAGLFGGFTVDASLSQTATAESAGARSQLSSIVTAALILLTAVLLAPLFADLPNAVLAAIVIAAVLGLMDVAELRRYAGSRRTDLILALVALVGVVSTTVLTGLAIAVVLSLTMMLYRASRPHIALLGDLGGEPPTYADVERHPAARPVPGLLMLRVDAPLYFFNVNVARSAVLDAVAARDPAPTAVLLDIGATADFDITTVDTIRQLIGDLRERSTAVLLAQVKGPVRDRMRRTGLMDAAGEDHVFLSVGTAVEAYRHRQAG
jgi:SulP family sulfate permease